MKKSLLMEVSVRTEFHFASGLLLLAPSWCASVGSVLRNPSLAALLLSSAAFAQDIPKEFPEGSVPITPASFAEKVVGKVFVGKIASGMEWTLDFNTNGRLYWSANGRPPDSGRYRLEGEKFCADMSYNPTCNEFRWKDSQIFYKRVANGEVVTLEKK